MERFASLQARDKSLYGPLLSQDAIPLSSAAPSLNVWSLALLGELGPLVAELMTGWLGSSEGFARARPSSTSRLLARNSLLLPGTEDLSGSFTTARHSFAKRTWTDFETPNAVDAAVRDKRARTRANLVAKAAGDNFLHKVSVSARTRKVYEQYVEDVVAAFGERLDDKTLHNHLDHVLEKYLNRLYQDGSSASEARNCLYGIAWHCRQPTRSPEVLPLAKMALKGFTRLDPGKSKDPGPWETALMIAAHSLAHHPCGVDVAASILCQFDMYLRPSEMNAIKKQDVLPPRGRYRSWSVIIAPSTELRTTKTMQQDDTLIVAETSKERAWLTAVIRALVHRATSDGSRLLQLDPQAVARLMKISANQLGLKPLALTPHSWRHGGASVDALAGVDITTIQRRGRWQCISSVRRYEKHGKLLRQIHKLAPHHLQWASSAESWLKTALPRALRGHAVTLPMALRSMPC